VIVDPSIHAPMGDMRWRLQSQGFDGLFSNEMQGTNKHIELKRDTNRQDGPKPLGFGPNQRASCLCN